LCEVDVGSEIRTTGIQLYLLRRIENLRQTLQSKLKLRFDLRGVFCDEALTVDGLLCNVSTRNWELFTHYDRE
jgi:hypothetical protein